mgnify:CR=1 FL=1
MLNSFVKLQTEETGDKKKGTNYLPHFLIVARKILIFDVFNYNSSN